MASSTGRFSDATLRFLVELERNNNRDWFNANKQRYEQEVLDAALRFVGDMQKPLRQISRHFLAVPKRVGGSVMRVYRDTRFARDKTPYKTNIGIQFRHEQGKDVHAPGYYVHIDPQRVFIGAGMWHPASAALAAIRERIDARPAEWQRARDESKFRRQFSLAGESLVRPPRGYSADHPLLADLRRKDFIAVKDLTHGAVTRRDFVERVAASFAVAAPLMRFLCKAVNVSY